MHCVKCKKKTDNVDIVQNVSKNYRNMMRGKCAGCGIIKSQFISKEHSGGDMVGVLNKLNSKVKLPLQKYKGEDQFLE